MTTYIEYELDDGSLILIEADEPQIIGMQETMRGGGDGNTIIPSGKKFRDALAGVKSSAKILREQLNELKADEVEVTFGLKATGEAGFFGIGKVGMAANYEVKLKWKNDRQTE